MISFVAKLWASSFSLPPLPPPQTRRLLYSVDCLYTNFKHVMAISDELAMAAYSDDAELNQWCIENHCHYLYDRAIYDRWMNRWSSNGIGGGDYYFIACNDDEYFVYAQMIWG